MTDREAMFALAEPPPDEGDLDANHAYNERYNAALGHARAEAAKEAAARESG